MPRAFLVLMAVGIFAAGFMAGYHRGVEVGIETGVRQERYWDRIKLQSVRQDDGVDLL